jgi:hypothetical protein
MKKVYTLGLCAVLVCGAFLLGYLVRGWLRALPLLEHPLVEINYSGGWLVHPEQALGSYRVYDDGRVFTITRGGFVRIEGTLSKDQIQALQDLISQPDILSDAFTKKEQAFCFSAVDGTDSEWNIRLASGQTLVYSDCDYSINIENAFIQEMHEIQQVMRD